MTNNKQNVITKAQHEHIVINIYENKMLPSPNGIYCSDNKIFHAGSDDVEYSLWRKSILR